MQVIQWLKNKYIWNLPKSQILGQSCLLRIFYQKYVLAFSDSFISMVKLFGQIFCEMILKYFWNIFTEKKVRTV